MSLTIHERDITSELCQRCGACCRVYLTVKGASAGYRQFLRTAGLSLDPQPPAGESDCCSRRHAVTVDAGFCHQLERTETSDGGLRCSCRIYGSSALPALCSEFNCVQRARVTNSYHEGNRLLRAAQAALDRLRAERGGACSSPGV